jgi:hypothetical protein
MRLRIAAWFLLVLGCPVAHAGIDSLNPMSWFIQKDATRYASKIAETIQDRPECQRFKDEIMAQAKGSPYDEIGRASCRERVS